MPNDSWTFGISLIKHYFFLNFNEFPTNLSPYNLKVQLVYVFVYIVRSRSLSIFVLMSQLTMKIDSNDFPCPNCTNDFLIFQSLPESKPNWSSCKTMRTKSIHCMMEASELIIVSSHRIKKEKKNWSTIGAVFVVVISISFHFLSFPFILLVIPLFMRGESNLFWYKNTFWFLYTFFQHSCYCFFFFWQT